jgi:(R,R)-butanediol dehydrogenase/meso-butanediol dehydrogenase/diacetyl reductase
MKVAVYVGPREPFRIEERPVPEPARDELLVRVDRCGICATDVHTWTGEAEMPIGGVYGHEFAGEVVGRGEAVDDFAVGERVTAQCVTACGECDACHEGHLVFCPDWRHHAPGGFAQYMTLPAREAYRLPSPLTAADGALVEPLAVGLHGVRLGEIAAGTRVLVLGAGPIGLCATFWARRLGAAAVAVAAPSDRRRRFALEMGATGFVRLGDSVDPEVAELLGGAPDVVLECAGVPGSLMQAIELARPKGTIVGMGYGLQSEEIVTAVPLFKELRLLFAMTYDRRDYRQVIETLASGGLEPRCLITDTVPLEGLTAAIEGLLDRAPQCKVMVDPWA